ncbi:MAG TPA: hypothetical protein PKY22_05030 [Accumulibacter sp.]|nr:hypothetical protein [Accumulibacter sp.]
MSDSSSNLDLIGEQDAGKATRVNGLVDAGSPATLFGRRQSLCSGLNWFYYGGILLVDGTPTAIANNSSALVLSANATNYVEATRAGVVSVNTTAFTAGRIPLYQIVTGAASVTSYSDVRAFAVALPTQTSRGSVTVTGADVTLSAVQSRCRYLTTAGTLTGDRAIIVPNDWEGIVYNGNTGAYNLTVKTASGTGIVVAPGKRAQLLADGTNVVRLAAEV